MPPYPNRDPLEGHPLYHSQGPLSSGSFGFVHLYQNKETKEQVAIKFLERHGVNKYVESEILNHRKLSSKSAHNGEPHCYPHVIEFKNVFLSNNYICIAMEYANGGNLLNYINKAGGRLKEAAARWFFQQLILGIDYCHRKGVVNRDIKLENTLLQVLPGVNHPPLIKICDFGYSKAEDMSAPRSKVGTLAYMAPEVITSTGAYNGTLSDVWSSAVMLYSMLFGVNPFDLPMDAAAEAALARLVGGRQLRQNEVRALRILNALWRFPDDAAVSTDCRDLLQKLMVADPNRRLGIPEIQCHPWFLVNLPAPALLMNDAYLASTDYAGMQSEEDIVHILADAQALRSTSCRPTLAEGGSNVEGSSGVDHMIDATIEEEVLYGMSVDMSGRAYVH